LVVGQGQTGVASSPPGCWRTVKEVDFLEVATVFPSRFQCTDVTTGPGSTVVPARIAGARRVGD
jgi:hypothetical protein